MRTPFQRDRDRIVHATSFRRLTYKTQVFLAHEGDHFRTRLTHSLEVSQIARSMARMLELDEDLAEALALAHDLGHPPFGHAGERALDAAMRAWGGFDHNAQSFKVVTALERKYADFDGLNLTLETLEGLVKHNGPLTGARGVTPRPQRTIKVKDNGITHTVPSPVVPKARAPRDVGEGQGGGDARASNAGLPPTPNPSPRRAEGALPARRGEGFRQDGVDTADEPAERNEILLAAIATAGLTDTLYLDGYAPAEAQVASLADDIAYNNHDIDDGLRAGLLEIEGLADVPFVGSFVRDMLERTGAIEQRRMIYEVNRRVITAMIEDVLAESRARLDALGAKTVDDIRAAGEPVIAFSLQRRSELKGLRDFLFKSVYRHERVMRAMRSAEAIVHDLFTRYMNDASALPSERGALIEGLPDAQRAGRVADFIAGMTDRYALAEHRRLFDATPELR